MTSCMLFIMYRWGLYGQSLGARASKYLFLFSWTPPVRKTPQTSCILTLCRRHFSAFESVEDAKDSHAQLKSFHPFLQFTNEVVSVHTLLFVRTGWTEWLFVRYQSVPKICFHGSVHQLESFCPQVPQDKPDFHLNPLRGDVMFLQVRLRSREHLYHF